MAREKKEKKEKKVKKSKVKVSAPKETTRISTAKKKTSIKPVKEAMTKKVMRERIMADTGMEARDVNKVINSIEAMILGSVVPKGHGEFVWPTLFVLRTRKKPATKERKGTNPFTGEPCVFKAKPASVVVKGLARAKLKKAAKGEL